MSSLCRTRYNTLIACVVILVATLAGLGALAPSASASPIIFDEHLEYPTGSEHPGGLTLADLDGDGHSDIATGCSSDPHAVSVLLNLGDGTFGTGTQYPTGGATRSPVAGDVDGDGDRDLVVALRSGEFGVAILRNDGLGHFGPPEHHAPANGVIDRPAVLDLDGDDDRDIVFAQSSEDEVVVLMNQGGGNFAPPVGYGGDPDAYFVHLSVGDVDGDDAPDLVIGRSLTSTQPSLYRNRGDGTFEPPQAIVVEDVYDFAGNDLGDLDGDGDLDLVFVSDRSSWVIALRNDGSGSFSRMGVFPSGVETQFGGVVTLADLDGDGRADAIVPAANTFRIATLRSSGAGFEAPAFHQLGHTAADVLAGYLDGDEDLDVACTLPLQDQVSILLNRSETTTAVGLGLEPWTPASFGPAHSNPAGRFGTSIPYVLAEPAHVRISVRDVAGRHIRSLFGGERPAGRQVVIWDGRSDGGALVAAGVYLIELNGGGWQRTARVVVLP
jgi:FG-GAP-like repeat/FlgD Ig-like domain